MAYVLDEIGILSLVGDSLPIHRVWLARLGLATAIYAAQQYVCSTIEHVIGVFSDEVMLLLACPNKKFNFAMQKILESLA